MAKVKDFVICLDMDEVLAHWLQPLLDATETPRESIKEWDLKSSPKVFEDFLARRFLHFYSDLKPIDGVFAGVSRLQLFADVYIVTSIPTNLPGKFSSNILEAKRFWVEQHLPMIDPQKIIVAHHKAMIRGDILVDDKTQNIEEWQATGRIGIVYDQPWNRECDASYRAHNWEDIVTYCKEVYEARKGVAESNAVSELRFPEGIY